MNTETKHTPGPWFVNGLWHIQADAHTDIPVIVAQVLPLRNGDNTQREANASVLAAAPELLQALKEIHKFWLCPDPTTMKAWAARCDVMADCARRAIAKAEGR